MGETKKELRKLLKKFNKKLIKLESIKENKENNLLKTKIKRQKNKIMLVEVLINQ